ncbi:MAG: hypothetical protein A3A33_03590 [Candidatus Yanofskybacteria bacterium RIFCSPLOWO2_01_FULL_49_25]|uniref:Uncharacterized protein n=1 Tax=Candidatus Yanofskybacteria bacterium RIFCSPLOWO2_01_FULL_49_25 TaxID=1802701 RepID=A0A1F8GVQ5_9BACT|nr:MAG: hypothetical protein A3A33_03590 [Candidatus Yanofskybacteria bacterium RIFCSPLOWO2_01_FULL_49_25]
MDKEKQPINSYRRNLLKLLLVGGGAFLVGKFASPFINFWNGDKVIDEKIFQNFKFVETGNALKVFDKEGSEIFVFEKDTF